MTRPSPTDSRALLDALPAFVAVARLGSFSAAATSLKLDPSRVSRIISGLESALGVALFARSTRKVRPTAEGLALLTRAGPALEALETAFHEASGGDAARPSGTVSLTASPDVARCLVAPLLPGFRQAFPDVEVELFASDAVVDLVADGIDCALRLGRPGRTAGTARRVTTITAAFFASPAYLERRGVPRTLDALAHHETLWPHPPRETVSFGGKHANTPKASVAADFSTLAAIACAGGGVALLPSFLAQDDVARGRLVRVLDAPMPSTPLYLVARPRPRPSRVEALLGYLGTALG